VPPQATFGFSNGRSCAVRSTPTGVTPGRIALGFGLELCQEGVTLANTDAFAVLNAKIDKIIIYACGAANTDGEQINQWGDGRRLCREIAVNTQAYVYASNFIQWFTTDSNREIHFGRWEGDLVEFSPHTGSARRIRSFPTRYTDGGY
jgi:hypothetical protein